MKLSTNLLGYKFLAFRKNGKSYTVRFNRLVAATRNADFKQHLVVDHKDLQNDNDVPKNLRSVTIKDNNNNRKERTGKKIMAIDENGNITHYNDAKHAVSVLGNSYSVERIRACAGKNNNVEKAKYTSGGYIWKYLIKIEKYVCKPGEYFINLYGNFQGVDLPYEKYMVSNLGTFLNSEKGYAKNINYRGYPTVSFNVNGNTVSEYVHVLLALIFIPGRTEEKCFVNHLNEQIDIFKIENLQWSTVEENMQYSAYKFGIPVKKICMKTGEVVGAYDSSTDGAISCNGATATHIREVCKGEGKSAYGFHWQYIPIDEIPNYPELTINQRKLLK